MDALKNILGDGAQDTIKSIAQSLSGASGGEGESGANNGGADLQRAVQSLSGMGNDPRAALLLSLKPYMSESRRRSIDSAVKLLNFSKLSGILKL